jgi:hypothetical protein
LEVEERSTCTSEAFGANLKTRSSSLHNEALVTV